MKQIVRVPIGDIVKMFGEAGSQGDFVKIPFPFPMVASWEDTLKLGNFYGHEHIGEAVIEALEEIKDYYGEAFILENKLNRWGGCFALRKTVSGKRQSVHSWGLAVDYLPHLGAYGIPATTPHVIVNAFRKRNFIWGGEWSVPDGMHFSAVIE